MATDVGITSTEILLGNTNALSGPAAAYGTISNASNAYYTYVNSTQGGVNGRKITYKILDDGYNPANTVTLTKQLVEQDKVFAMFGGLGTQAQTSVRDYMNAQKVPQIFVYTGATTWGLDYSKYNYTMGWIPSYQAESHIYAQDILKNHTSAKIGVLYQNDDYGTDYLKGLKDGLGSSASLIVDSQSYDVTAASVASQVATLKGKGVDTLFLFSTPKFTVQALVTVSKLNWDSVNDLPELGLQPAGLHGPRGQGWRRAQERDQRRLPQGPDRPAVGQRRGHEAVQDGHRQLLDLQRQQRVQHLRRGGGLDAGRRLEEGRIQPHAPERDGHRGHPAQRD